MSDSRTMFGDSSNTCEICDECKCYITDQNKGLQCNHCSLYYHKECGNISKQLFIELHNSDILVWVCTLCRREKVTSTLNTSQEVNISTGYETSNFAQTRLGPVYIVNIGCIHEMARAHYSA